MSIITLSRGSYSKGKEVAEKVAQRLGYECLSREVVLEASGRYHIPEIKMVKAIHDAPSILDRLNHSKKSFIACYQSALARHVQKDNVVYHGLAGHLLLTGIPHVFKVRVIADLSDRIRNEMKREGISEKKARASLQKDDNERRKWTQSLYGVDPWDSSLYDLVIHIHQFSVEDAVDFICRGAALDPFKTTRESQRKMDDLALASQVKAELLEWHQDIEVTCEYGNVLIETHSEDHQMHKLENKARALAKEILGIHHIEVHSKLRVSSSAL